MIWWPVVQARLVTLLPTLDGFATAETWADGDALVHDGPPLTETGTQRWVSVGWSSTGDSGGWDFVEDSIDGMRGERGRVVCEFVVWGGDENLPGYRADCFDLVNTLDTAVRADQRLGVLPVTSTSDLSAEVVSAQDKTGATQRLIVTVAYFARS